MGVSIEEVHDLELLEHIVRASDIVIDAIDGTGVHGIIRGIGYEVIPIINENAKHILSVDIPSGLNAAQRRNMRSVYKGLPKLLHLQHGK